MRELNTFPLQNQPNSNEFPVSVPQVSFREGFSRLRGFKIYILVFTVVAGLLVAFGLESLSPLLERADGDLVAAISLVDDMTQLQIVGSFVLAALWVIGMVLYAVFRLRRPTREQRRPVTEQLHYYKLRGKAAPSEEELRAMRIAGSWCYEKTIWPLTLEYAPLAIFVPERQQHRFETFALREAEDEREQLQSDWGMYDADSFRENLDEYLESGVHSKYFAVDMQFDAERCTERLAAIAGVSRSAVADCFVSAAGRPPKLLWAFDLIRLHHMVRAGFMAGYLDEATAWKYLERVTDYTAAIFETEAEYLENLKLGQANYMGPGQIDAVKWRAEVADEYLRSDWPPQLGAWPAKKHLDLPEPMATGFLKLRMQIQEQRAAARGSQPSA